MSEITITLPDGSQKQVARGTTALQVAEGIGARLAKAAVAAKFNDQVIDLSRPLQEDGSLAILTFKDAEGQDVYWHSAAHIMADAVVRLFPHAKPTIGPAIEEGFYYDFHVDRPFNDEDLERIEAEMHKIVAADEPFACHVVPAAEAKAQWELAGNEYKVELVADIVAGELGEEAPRGADNIRAFEAGHAADYDRVSASIYEHGSFVDLCRGPHVPSTGAIKALKLTSTSGAYWRGSENNPMLQRIYGIAFPDKKLLDEYLEKLEQAKARDHRKLGRELDLFSFHEEAGAGLPYYHPNGAMLRHLVTDFATREHLKRGYVLLRTPHLIKSDIWYTSGHAQQGYPMYYTEIEGQSYGIKPMNCPGHILIYKTHKHSYRELPLRYFELGTVNRHEKSGVLHGLLRVREFTQDDAHIFCRQDQLHPEISAVIAFIEDVMRIFGFEYELEISTRPDKFIGREEDWNRAEEILKNVLDERSIPYDINEGDGAFYGPKIDVKLKDALGRKWQCATIQLDFALPERFDLHYVDSDGKRKKPVMLHRVVLGAMERFIGILIEHYAGRFPLWLSPVQVLILTITDDQLAFATQLRDMFQQADIRVEMDTRNEKLGLKIREGTLKKVPYLIIVGKKEVETGTISVRGRDGSETKGVTPADFIHKVTEENNSRR